MAFLTENEITKQEVQNMPCFHFVDKPLSESKVSKMVPSLVSCVVPWQ